LAADSYYKQGRQVKTSFAIWVLLTTLNGSGQRQIKRIGPEILRFGKKTLLVYGRESIRKNGIAQGAGLSIVLPGIKFYLGIPARLQSFFSIFSHR
jgi:hypothetical protein